MIKKLMLIEDEELFQDLFKEIFAKPDYQIICVNNGSEALNHPRQDLYIVDLGLPGMGGLETLEALRQKFGDDIRSIIITGYDPSIDKKTLEKYGIIEVLQKPFDIDRLKSLIHTLFLP